MTRATSDLRARTEGSQRIRWAVTLMVIVMLSSGLGAQTAATLTGAVVDRSGGAIVSASVHVQDGGGTVVKDAQTDANGTFSVVGLAPGRYVIRVESRQFEPSVTTVDVRDGGPSELRIVMDVRGLREQVTVAAPGGFTRPSGTAATRFEADTLAVPQSSQSLMGTFIQAQGAIDVGDVLKQVPSAYIGHTRLAPFTSFSWRLRGLDAAVTRNGFRQLYFEDVDQSAFLNIDRVEVIKGPGGAVYGKEGLGGVIHMVTKRPQQTLSTTAQASFGQYGMRSGGIDITGPVGHTGLAIRFNAELERSGSFVDHQDMDRSNIAFSAATAAEKRVRGFVNVEYQQRDTLPNPGLPVVGTALGSGPRVDRATYLGEPDVDFLKTWAPLTQAWVDVDLGRGWTLSPRYQHFAFNVDQQQIQLRAPVAGNPSLIQRTGRFDFHERDKTHVFQLELKGRATIGRMKHQLLAGFEANRHHYDGDWLPFSSVPVIDSLSPAYLGSAPPRAASRTTFSGDLNTNEPYVQDLISLDRLDVLLGLRHAQINIDSEFLGFLTPDQNHGGLAYQAGAAFRLVPTWSLFVGASTGLSADNIVGSTAADGTPFEPERSRQIEVGVKHQSGRTSGSAAFFDITFANATTGDPNNPDFQLQIGEQRSRGVEFEASLQAASRWYLTTGLAVIDATISRSNDGDEGNRLPNTARVQANLWSRFEIERRVHAAFGLNVVGRHYGTLSNSYELPRYGTVDASVTWQATPRAVVELFAQNLLDRTYFTGSNNNAVFPGEPRTVYVRLRAILDRR